MSTSTIDFRQFYEMFDPIANRPFRLTPVDDWITAELAIHLSRGENQPIQPLRFRARSGGQPAPFLWSGLTPLLCAYEQVISILTEHGFTGWSTYPVEVYSREAELLPNYVGFAITGRGGEQDLGRSELITKPPRVVGGKPYEVYRGFYFDPANWDGSDLFFVRGVRVVKEQIVRAFRRAKISNVRFTPLPEVEIGAAVYRIRKKEN